MQRETAESSYLDALSRGKSMSHMFDHSFHRPLDVLKSKMAVFFRQEIDQF